MPSIQRLAVWSADVEGSDLVFREAELFCVIDVVVEECVDLVGVERTVGRVSAA